MNFVSVATSLVDERFPNARAAVLAGSAADGSANEFSDLDIVVVLEGAPAPFRETTRVGDRLVELFVHTEASLEYWFDQDRQQGLPTLANMLATGVALSGADAVKRRAREHVAAGPAPWTDEQFQYRRYVNVERTRKHCRPARAWIVHPLRLGVCRYCCVRAPGRGSGWFF